MEIGEKNYLRYGTSTQVRLSPTSIQGAAKTNSWWLRSIAS